MKLASQKWLHPALAIIAAVIVLAVLLVTQPWEHNPQSNMVKAYEAISELKSYRMIGSFVATFEGDKTESTYEMEYTAPDRCHMKTVTNGEARELIVIGDEIYSREPEEMGAHARKAMAISVSSSVPSREQTLETLDSLTDLKELPDENIDGIDCLHYCGRVDMERQVEEQKASLDPNKPEYDEMLEMLEQQIEEMRKVKAEVELWIGKDDYIIRQIKHDTQVPSKDTGKLDTLSSVLKYYDFNKPITIELPLDASDELLPGWQLVGSPSVNGTMDERTFSRNVTVTIGGEDPAHQHISFRVTITNISEEVTKNVRVTLSTMATNDESGRWKTEVEPSNPGPVNLEPGENESYNITWEYDATHTSKEELSRLVDLTTILARYNSLDGEEAVQLLFPDAPYPSARPPERPPGD